MSPKVGDKVMCQAAYLGTPWVIGTVELVDVRLRMLQLEEHPHWCLLESVKPVPRYKKEER